MLPSRKSRRLNSKRITSWKNNNGLEIPSNITSLGIRILQIFCKEIRQNTTQDSIYESARDSTSLKNKDIFQSQKTWSKRFIAIKSTLYVLYHLSTKAIHSLFRKTLLQLPLCVLMLFVCSASFMSHLFTWLKSLTIP